MARRTVHISLPYSNCQGSLILDVLRYAKYEPQVLQVELHPYLSQEALVSLCKTLGIVVTAYSSFGPQSYLELGMAKDSSSLLQHNLVATIAATHKKSVLPHIFHLLPLDLMSCCTATAQVLLRWATQRGIAVIPKSNHLDRLVANLQCHVFDLSDAEIASISALNINYRVSTDFWFLCRTWQKFLRSSTTRRISTLDWLFSLEWTEKYEKYCVYCTYDVSRGIEIVLD